MPKITKDFTDALGFRLLSCYNGFVQEFPVEGARIQKIYDEGFKETCYKCYPIIAETGIDAANYEPTAVSTLAVLKSELRKKFPIKIVEKKEVKKPSQPEVKEIVAEIKQVKVVEKPMEYMVIDTDEESVFSTLTECTRCMRLSKANERLLETNEALKAHNETLKESNNMMHKKIEELKDEVKNKEKVISIHEKEIEELKNEVKNKDKLINMREKEIADLLDQRQEFIIKEKARHMHAFTNLNSEKIKQENIIHELQEENAKYKQAFGNIINQYKSSFNQYENKKRKQ